MTITIIDKNYKKISADTTRINECKKKIIKLNYFSLVSHPFGKEKYHNEKIILLITFSLMTIYILHKKKILGQNMFKSLSHYQKGMPIKTALTITAYDQSGGTGIQGDLKTFSYAKIHGASIITCITAQNISGVNKIYPLDANVIETQLDILMNDLHIAATKTGILCSQKIIQLISKKIQEYGFKAIVDPVMAVTPDYQYTQKNNLKTLIHALFPHTYLVTPNIDEAASLTQTKIDDLKTIKKACEIIREMGPRFVLITGGHLPGKYARDTLYDGKKFTMLSLPRVKSNARGAGCTVSALITAYVTKGFSVHEAIEKAKQCSWAMLYYSYRPGKGNDVINHSPPHHPISLQSDDVPHWIKLQKSIDYLVSFLPLKLIPEVGINFAYALPYATQTKDVLGISGRIIKRNEKPFQAGEIQLGGSRHIASIIITCMKKNPHKRSAINIAYSPEIVALAKRKGWKTGTFDRKEEPPNRRTMDWGTETVIHQQGYIPDIIWDTGSPGKEPMIRVISETPQGILKIIKSLTEKY